VHVLGIIPARGGSKGVKNKNIRLVAGKPLLYYTVEAATASELDYVVGSTEDSQIKSHFYRAGCNVIDRPGELARDESPTFPVLHHVVETLSQKEGLEFDYIMLLQPTTPLRSANDINEALLVLDKERPDILVSVYEVEDHHPSRMYRLVSGKLKKLMKEPASRRRQDLEPIYHRNGAIYAYKTSLINPTKHPESDNMIPFIMPIEKSLNIDNEWDLKMAQLILNA